MFAVYRLSLAVGKENKREMFGQDAVVEVLRPGAGAPGLRMTKENVNTGWRSLSEIRRRNARVEVLSSDAGAPELRMTKMKESVLRKQLQSVEICKVVKVPGKTAGLKFD